MSDLYKTLLISRPQVLSSGGSGLLVAANNLSDVADVSTARTNLGVASAIEQASNDSGRKKEGFLYSDGATTSRGQVQTLTSRGNLAGAPLASWVGWVDVPSSNPSANAHIAKMASNATSDFTANGLTIYFVASSASLTITAIGTTLGTDFRNFTHSSFRTSYSGQRIWLDVRLTNGSSVNPVVYVNGADVSSSFSSSTGGTAPDWLGSSLSITNFLTGFAWPAGIAPLGCWLNAHLTNAESETWRLTGRAPAWVALGGSQVDVKPTSGSFAYWFGTGSVVSSTATQVVTSAGASGLNVRNPALTVTPVQGAKVLVNATVSGLTGSVIIQLSNFSLSAVATTIVADGTYNLEIVPTTTSQGNVVIAVTSTTQATITINSVQLRGALSLPSVQSIGVVEDITAIGGNQARLVGNTPILLDSVPVSVIELPAISRTGSTEILGGAISGARKRRIVSVTGNSSASVNLSLGTTASGTQLINAQAVNGDFDITTFASRILAAGSSLHLSFSSTTTASIHIHLTDL